MAKHSISSKYKEGYEHKHVTSLYNTN